MEENNLPLQTDTSAFTAFMGNTSDMYKPNNLYTPEPTLTKFDDTPVKELSNFVAGIKFDTSMNAMNLFSNKASDWRTAINPYAGKIDATTTVPLTETHTMMSDGETWMPKYENYMAGVDNDARLAMQQTDSEKFWNPVKRFAQNTSLGVADLAAGVYGLMGAAFTGKLDTIYDNDFAHAIDNMTERNNLQFKNYYTEAQRNQNLGLNNQTWDKFLGGAEFTARMLVGEGAITVGSVLAAPFTGGTSLAVGGASAAAKLSKFARTADKLTDIAEEGSRISKLMGKILKPEIQAASKGISTSQNVRSIVGAADDIANTSKSILSKQKTLENLNKFRFATMSPLYEAGFEARHARMEMEEDFYNYYRDLGRNPTTDEINKFAKKMDGAAEAVFYTNMAILAPSNLATLGTIVGVQTPFSRFATTSGKAFDKNILRIGIETGEDGVKRAIKYNKGHQLLGALVPVAKGMFVEGVFEEGSQGIASNTLKNYVASSYDPKAMRETANYIDAFGKAYSDQFGTKEGREEIMIGALIGGLMGGVGGASENRNKRKSQSTIANIENQGDAFNASLREDGYRSAWLQELVKHGNREGIINDKIERSEAEGDYLGVAKGKQERFISLLQAYKSVGREADFVKMITATVKGFDANTMSETSGVSLDKIEAYKAHSIEQLEKTAETYSNVYDAAMKVFKKNPFGANAEIQLPDGSKRKATANDYAAGLAYATSMAEFNKNVAKDSYNLFLNKLANNISDDSLIGELGAFGAIMSAGKVELDSYKKVSEDLASTQDKLNKLRDKLTQENRTDENKTVDVSKITKSHTEYQILSKQLSDLYARKEALWSNMTSNFYEGMEQKGFATSMDVNNFSDRVSKMQEALSKLPASEQQGLNEILNVFNAANNEYRGFANLYDQLSDPTVAFKGANNGAWILPIGKAVAKSQEKITSDKVKDAYKKMVSLNSMSKYGREAALSEKTPVITEEVFKDEGEPSIKVLDYMKSKLNNNENFSQYEQKYYDKHKSKIDSHEISEEVKSENPIEETPLMIEKARKQALALRLKNFKEGKYTDEQAAVIEDFDKTEERLNKEISELRSQLSDIKYELDTKEYDDQIENLENKIEDLEKEAEENLKNLGYEIKEDGIYHYGEKISDDTSPEIITEHVKEFRKNFKEKVKQLDKTNYNLFYYIKGEDIVSGNLQQLSTDERLPITLREAILESISTGNPVEIPMNVTFGEVTEDDINVDKNKVTVKYIGEDGKEYFDEYFAIKSDDKYGNFSDNFVFGTKDGVTFVDNGVIVEEENEDGIIERYINVKYKKPGKSNRTNFKLTGIIVDKIIFETIYNEFNKRATNEQKQRLNDYSANRRQIADTVKEIATKREDRANAINNEKQRVESERNNILANKLAPLEVEHSKTLKNRLDYLSEQEKILDDEMKGINGNISKFNKINRLKNTIKSLKAKLMSTEFAKESSKFTDEELEKMNPLTEDAKEYYKDLKKLLNYQRQLIALENEDTIKPFSENMTNAEKITWISNNIEGVEVSTIDEAVNLTPPTNEELQEFYRLRRKRKRTTEDNQNLEKLRDKIFQFELVSHIPGMSLQELVMLAEQQANAIQLAANEVGTSLETLETGIEVTSNMSELNKKRDEINPAVSNINDFALVGISKSKPLDLGGNIIEGPVVRTLHNKKPQEFIEKLMKSGWDAYVIIKDSKYDIIHEGVIGLSDYFEYGNLMDSNPDKDSSYGSMQKISIVFMKDGEKFTMERDRSPKAHKGRININEEGFETFLNAVGIKAFKQKGIANNYMMLYDEKTGGVFTPMTSDKPIDVVNENGQIEFLNFDVVEANSLKKGDSVEVVYDENDGLNIILSKRKNYDAARDGRFHIYSNGKLVGLLKGPKEEDLVGKKSSSSWNKLVNFRKSVIENGGRLETKVNNSFINFPLYQFDSEMKPLATPIREDKVITYAYVQNGIITPLDEKYKDIEVDINFAGGDFLPKDGKLRPIAIFETSGKKAAFPINLVAIGENEDVGPVIKSIFESDITGIEKAIAINNELTRIGMNTESNLVTPETTNIDYVLKAVEDYKTKIDITNPQYYKGATSYIDFNNPFSGAKLHVSTAVAKASDEVVKEIVDTNEKLKTEVDDAIDNNIC